MTGSFQKLKAKRFSGGTELQSACQTQALGIPAKTWGFLDDFCVTTAAALAGFCHFHRMGVSHMPRKYD
jgi:hypothetical protein